MIRTWTSESEQPTPPGTVDYHTVKAMTAEPAESWMTRLVPGGEYSVQVAGHPLLRQIAEWSGFEIIGRIPL